MDTQRNLAAMLVDLANLHPGQESVARLRKKWPDLLPATPPQYLTYKRVMFSATSIEEVPLKEPDEFEAIMWIQYIVRALWRGDPEATVLRELEHILLYGGLGVQEQREGSGRKGGPLPGIVGIDWKHRSFVYRPQTVLQGALYYLLQHSNHAKVCGNPDCPTPYFIAPRSNTKYCSSDCVEVTQRAAKRDWWERSGPEWRKQRQEERSERQARRKG